MVAARERHAAAAAAAAAAASAAGIDCYEEKGLREVYLLNIFLSPLPRGALLLLQLLLLQLLLLLLLLQRAINRVLLHLSRSILFFFVDIFNYLFFSLFYLHILGSYCFLLEGGGL